MNKFDMELTQKQAKEYKRSAKKKRSEIIDRYCELTGVSRNVASKRFRKVVRNEKPRVLKKESGKKRGRKSKYNNSHKDIVKMVWELSGEICGERLHPVLSEYVTQLKTAGRLTTFDDTCITETRHIPFLS